MGLNLTKGNMYSFINSTWNPIKGKCEDHDCSYCYMKRFGHLKAPRLVEKEFKEFERDIKEYDKPQYIFVGSSIDMFAKSIPSEWIWRVLKFLKQHNNTYLFQSKNPARFYNFTYPYHTVLGTTIESNRDYPEISNAPKIADRVRAMANIRSLRYETMVTLEPILAFDTDELVTMLNTIKPKFINIGADSGGHNLPEPSKEKLIELMDRINYRKKKNLQRLLK